eukprot:TRINITY_DN12277_c0_g1_i1.p1 TRINITY_DN12277_c0_g1~~TRINITY_DN12277_c0_g1_i1.p1  ORF type:complete len:1455 (+),score=169.45 TRINITY_DN12277_c0_g1_i1:66-4430(+)
MRVGLPSFWAGALSVLPTNVTLLPISSPLSRAAHPLADPCGCGRDVAPLLPDPVVTSSTAWPSGYPKASSALNDNDESTEYYLPASNNATITIAGFQAQKVCKIALKTWYSSEYDVDIQYTTDGVTWLRAASIQHAASWNAHLCSSSIDVVVSGVRWILTNPVPPSGWSTYGLRNIHVLAETTSPTATPSAPPTPLPTAPTKRPSRPPSTAPTAPPARPSSSPTRPPEGSPTGRPTAGPSVAPTLAPAPPSAAPTGSPSASPTTQPTRQPVEPPTTIPTQQPLAPSASPTSAPSPPPSTAPTAVPSGAPTSRPSTSPRIPTAAPSLSPTAAPSLNPTAAPSLNPTLRPTAIPSIPPSNGPSSPPSYVPTADPSPAPIAPTATPSLSPTGLPSPSPTKGPASVPTSPPSKTPTSAPVALPTAPPSQRPTLHPTAGTAGPSGMPSPGPSSAPSRTPTGAPTQSPRGPTSAPSLGPTGRPFAVPSVVPSPGPTLGPSTAPTVPPLPSPSFPTAVPSAAPTMHPSAAPQAGARPTTRPSKAPAVGLTLPPRPSPTRAPAASRAVSRSPTGSPSVAGQPAPGPTADPSPPNGSTAGPASPSRHPGPSPTPAPARPQPAPGPSQTPSSDRHPTQSPYTADTPTSPPASSPAYPSSSPTAAPTTRAGTTPTAAPVAPAGSREAPTTQPSEAPSLSPSALPVVPATVLDTAPAVGTATVALGVAGAAGAASLGNLAIASDVQCSPEGTMRNMSRALHPTGLMISGSPYAGCLMSAILIISGTALLSVAALAALTKLDSDGDRVLSREDIERSFLSRIPVVRDAPTIDLAALVRHPNNTLLAMLFLYQGTAFSSLRLLLLGLAGNEPWWAVIIGAAVAILLLLFPVFLRRQLRRGVQKRLRTDFPGKPDVRARVRPWDPPRPPRWLQYVLLSETGDWVSRHREHHWINKWNSAVRPFQAAHAANGAFADMAAMWLLGLINAFPTPTLTSCGHVRLACAIVHLFQLAYCASQQPYRCLRDDVGRSVVLILLIAALISLALGFYSGAASGDESATGVLAQALLQGTFAVVLLQLVLRVVAEGVLFIKGYRTKSQMLEWAEADERQGKSDDKVARVATLDASLELSLPGARSISGKKHGALGETLLGSTSQLPIVEWEVTPVTESAATPSAATPDLDFGRLVTEEDTDSPKAGSERPDMFSRGRPRGITVAGKASDRAECAPSVSATMHGDASRGGYSVISPRLPSTVGSPRLHSTVGSPRLFSTAGSPRLSAGLASQTVGRASRWGHPRASAFGSPRTAERSVRATPSGFGSPRTAASPPANPGGSPAAPITPLLNSSAVGRGQRVQRRIGSVTPGQHPKREHPGHLARTVSHQPASEDAAGLLQLAQSTKESLHDSQWTFGGMPTGQSGSADGPWRSGTTLMATTAVNPPTRRSAGSRQPPSAGRATQASPRRPAARTSSPQPA